MTTLKEHYPYMVFSEELLGIPTVSTLNEMKLHFIKKNVTRTEDILFSVFYHVVAT